MASNVATQQRNPVAVMQQALTSRQEEIKKALPGHISVEKFIRTAQTAIVGTRNIESANPQSLLIACSKAAADGLILDGREAALVIDYKGEVQYRPMMRGLLKLAYNSGLVKAISVQVVHENDEFEYFLGDDERIHHKIDFRAARGNPIAVYAVAHLADDVVMHEVMTVEQINGIRDRSDAWKAHKAGKIKSTPWSTDWTEMARKTVFRRLSKWLPSSTDRDTLHSAAERIDEDYSFDPQDDDAQPEVTVATTKKRGGAKAALAQVIDQEPEHDEDGVVQDEPDLPDAPPVEAYEPQAGDDI